MVDGIPKVVQTFIPSFPPLATYYPPTIPEFDPKIHSGKFSPKISYHLFIHSIPSDLYFSSGYGIPHVA